VVGSYFQAIARRLPRIRERGRLQESPIVIKGRKRRQPVKPLFVGGSWRSGTTLLHALICTSGRTNDYIGECSYFSALTHALSQGLVSYTFHTRYYFASREEFIAHHASILRDELQRVWERTGRSAVLALKDPLLTPRFPLLASTLPEARRNVSTTMRGRVW
jgi:hypothetical protein